MLPVGNMVQQVVGPKVPATVARQRPTPPVADTAAGQTFLAVVGLRLRPVVIASAL